MADDMLSIRVRGLDALHIFLSILPYGTKKAAIAAATEYLLGDNNHGLRYYPARVEHGPDNPYQFQTEKQRRAYFASNGFGGGIPSQRTFTLRDGWQSRPLNNGYDARIINTAPHAVYVQGKYRQRGHDADKWQQTPQIIADNIRDAMRAAMQAVDRIINQKGK